MCRAAMSMLVILFLPLAGATFVESNALIANPQVEHRHTGGHDMSGGSDRGYHRSFDNAEMWAKEFDDPARDALHLERTARVADLGAGTGYFGVLIAKRVPEGKVFAIDIEPEMVRYLRERGDHESLGVL